MFCYFFAIKYVRHFWNSTISIKSNQKESCIKLRNLFWTNNIVFWCIEIWSKNYALKNNATKIKNLNIIYEHYKNSWKNSILILITMWKTEKRRKEIYGNYSDFKWMPKLFLNIGFF